MLVATVLAVPSAAASEAPQYTIGDTWSYTISFTALDPELDLGDVAIFVNVTFVVTALEEMTVGNDARQVVNESVEVDAHIFNDTVDVEFTVTGHQAKDLLTFTTLKLDGSFSGSFRTTVGTTVTIGISGSFTLTTSEIEGTWGFPLDVGKRGSVTTTSSASLQLEQQDSLFPDIEPIAGTSNTTFEVLRTEDVSVEAGSFEALVIEQEIENETGLLLYYAPQIGNYAKMEILDSEGSVTATMELASYRYATAELIFGLPPLYWAAIGGVLAVVVVAVVVLLVVRRRPKVPPPPPPEGP